MLRGENENRPPLTASEIEIVRSRVTGFVSDKSADAELLCGGSFILPQCNTSVIVTYNLIINGIRC